MHYINAKDNEREVNLAECSSESLTTIQTQKEKVFRPYFKGVKDRKKLEACEREVTRLLERCEDYLY